MTLTLYFTDLVCFGCLGDHQPEGDAYAVQRNTIWRRDKPECVGVQELFRLQQHLKIPLCDVFDCGCLSAGGVGRKVPGCHLVGTGPGFSCGTGCGAAYCNLQGSVVNTTIIMFIGKGRKQKLKLN